MGSCARGMGIGDQILRNIDGIQFLDLINIIFNFIKNSRKHLVKISSRKQENAYFLE